VSIDGVLVSIEVIFTVLLGINHVHVSEVKPSSLGEVWFEGLCVVIHGL